MYLIYIDESGSTGNDLDNKNQPFFVLSGICIEDKKWHTINDYFEQEKIKICSDLKNIEIHTNELFNSNPKSFFYKNYWKDNFIILEKLVDLIASLDIKITNAVVNKKNYKKHFGNNIIVDPYLYAFAILYNGANKALVEVNDYGIIFCDEIKTMEKSLEILYPRLKTENKNIIERTFYLNSKQNNFIQIADICAFYTNKYNCIIKNNFTMNPFKKDHCLKMYSKLYQKFGNYNGNIDLNNFDSYFK